MTRRRDPYGPQRARVLDLLRTRGVDGASTNELCTPKIGGYQGCRRVRELREQGYPIQRGRMPTGYWRYWLGPTPPTAQLDLFWADEP